MINNLPTGVVVGVDGSAGSDSAVRYGALEAARLDTDLTLVHVVPDYVPLAPMPPLVPDDLADVGRRIVTDARELTRRYAQDVRVTTLVRTGSATATLDILAQDARLVVLGRNLRSPLHHVFTGAVTSGVASRAACPVVSIPDGWGPTAAEGGVIVGFKDSTHGSGALEQAFASAGARGGRLTVIHAWELPSVYDDIIVRRTHDEDWNVQALVSIESRILGLRKAYPDVVVAVRIAHAQPAHALIEATSDADLLIIERRGGRLPAGFHLGGTARAVLREATCPVEILPPHGAPVELDRLELESAGVPLK